MDINAPPRPAVPRPPTFTGLFIFIFLMITFVGCLIAGVTAAIISRSNHMWGPGIGLTKFAVSNLSISDNQISGNWAIKLGLNNGPKTSAMYGDIKYTVVYSGAPNVPIVDSVLGRSFLQRPNNNTSVHFNGWSEKVGLSHLVADSMTRDVIDDGALEFDVVAVALVFMKMYSPWNPEGPTIQQQRIVVACKGVRVLITPAKSAPVNGRSRATQIPACHLVRLVDV